MTRKIILMCPCWMDQRILVGMPILLSGMVVGRVKEAGWESAKVLELVIDLIKELPESFEGEINMELRLNVRQVGTSEEDDLDDKKKSAGSIVLSGGLSE